MDSPIQANLSPPPYTVAVSPESERQLETSQGLSRFLEEPVQFQPATNLTVGDNEEMNYRTQVRLATEAVKKAAKRAMEAAAEIENEGANGCGVGSGDETAVGSSDDCAIASSSESENEPGNKSGDDFDSGSMIGFGDENCFEPINGYESGSVIESKERNAFEPVKDWENESAIESVPEFDPAIESAIETLMKSCKPPEEPTEAATKETPNNFRKADLHTNFKKSDESISSRWQRHVPKGRGFSNRGNCCYRNSVLQALFHIPKIVNWIEGAHRETCERGKEEPPCIMCALRKLCVRYWGEPGGKLRTNLALAELEGCLKETRTFEDVEWKFDEQNDAYLFLLHLFVVILETKPSLSYITNTLLGHTTITKRTCIHCNRETERNTLREQERILQVAWDQETSLSQILSNREFNNVYDDLRCDACNANRSHPFQKRLWLVPDVLIIHLKRFEPNEDGSSHQKKTDKIVINKSLDLTTLNFTGAPLFYTLQAVVQHRGSLNFGHYVTDAKGPHGSWERLDDQKVYPSTVEKALDPSPTCKYYEEPWTPYLLFYTKCDNLEDLDEEISDDTEEDQAQKPNFNVKCNIEQPTRTANETADEETANVTMEGQGLEPNTYFPPPPQAVMMTGVKELHSSKEGKRSRKARLKLRHKSSTQMLEMVGEEEIPDETVEVRLPELESELEPRTQPTGTSEDKEMPDGTQDMHGQDPEPKRSPPKQDEEKEGAKKAKLNPPEQAAKKKGKGKKNNRRKRKPKK